MCLVTTTLVVPAAASKLSRTAELFYRDIKFRFDFEELTLTDADGNTVEPFIIDGTTYLPVRALANALGISVRWEEYNSTVNFSRYIFTASDHPQRITGKITDIASNTPGDGMLMVYTEDGGLYRWDGFDLYGCYSPGEPHIEKLIGLKEFSSFCSARFATGFVDKDGVLWQGSHGDYLKKSWRT